MRTLFALEAICNLNIHQMDMKSTFLNGELIDKVYMVQLNNYEVNGKENLICKLKKAIYGLKQKQRVYGT
jgi:hypothetical protein